MSQLQKTPGRPGSKPDTEAQGQDTEELKSAAEKAKELLARATADREKAELKARKAQEAREERDRRSCCGGCCRW